MDHLHGRRGGWGRHRIHREISSWGSCWERHPWNHHSCCRALRLFWRNLSVISLNYGHGHCRYVPGMRPWKSKEGRPLVNPEGKPPAYSGFLLGRSADEPKEDGAAGRGRCWGWARAGPSFNGAKSCSEDEGGAKDDGAPLPRCAPSALGSRRSGLRSGRSPDCSGRGRLKEDDAGGGRKACWRGTPAFCLDPLLERAPALKSTWRFWLKFLCGTTGTWMGFPAAALLLLLPVQMKQHQPIRR